MRKIKLMTIIMAAAVSMATQGPAWAKISEPDVIFSGKAINAQKGSSVTIKLNGTAVPMASHMVGASLQYVLRVAMDAFEPRTPGTAVTGDTAEIFVNGVLAATAAIPKFGSIVNLNLGVQNIAQWEKDHPGDNGSGDMNRNGISDLQDYLNGKDPADCVWNNVDASHAETTVYHPLVLQNCLASAGADQKHNLIRVARGSYAGNFTYNSAWGETYDLTLIGGYDPEGAAERSADPALTILNGDTDNDGVGNGVVLVFDGANKTLGTLGKVRIESLTIKNGKAPAGQNGGGIQAHIYQRELELVGNIIRGNTADSGGGVSVDSGDSGSIFLTNNILFGNSAANAAAARIVSAATGSVTLLNNTIADNAATAEGDGRSLLIKSTTASIDMTNNIIAGVSGVNGKDIYINSAGAAIPLSITHNAFDAVNGLHVNAPGFVPDATIIGDAPLFAAPQTGDYRLSLESPCIDRGSAHAKLPGKDAVGAIRTSGGGIDMGAYEFPGFVARVTLGSLNAVYDGTQKMASAATTPAGLTVSITYNDSATAPTTAGSYKVKAVVNDAVYQGMANGTLVISKATATVTITPESLTATYDGTLKNAMATTDPPGKKVTFTYNGSALAPTNAGSYAVVATISDINYQGTAGGTLIIAKATPTITWANPAAISAGTALSAAQLNATANVAGSFAYIPEIGAVPRPSSGTQTLSAVFTPLDRAMYNSQTASVTLTVTGIDTSAPTVSAFSIPASAASLTVAVTTLTANDNVGVTGYLLSETASQPQPTDAAWTASQPTQYTVASQGTKILYAFAKDAYGNISAPASASVAIALADTTPPMVSAFSIPANAVSLTISIPTLSATDNVGVTAYLLSTAAGQPQADDAAWSLSVPTQYAFASPGTRTLYAFAKDGAGNISAPRSASVTITLADATVPVVNAFGIPAISNSLTVAVSTLNATDNAGVAAYLLSETASQPADNDVAWTANKPTQYSFASPGAKDLFAFAKDIAGNISVPASATVTIVMADAISPTVDGFTVPATSSALIVAVSSFNASDNAGVTGYLISESAFAAASDIHWTETATSSYTFGSAGSKTLYAYAKDAAGNVSAPVAANVVITLSDITAPAVTAFGIPAASSDLTIVVSSLTANDDIAVTGFMLTESATAPDTAAAGWTSTAPASYTFGNGGSKTLYAYAKDAAGNISAPTSASVTITLSDSTAPTVTVFAIPSSSTKLTIPVTTVTAGDNVAVTGYMLTESATVPEAAATGWTSMAPASYTFGTAGSKTVYAYAKDAAGNISVPATANVTITLRAAVNGVCGSANNAGFATAPTSNLCISGIASGVTGSGPWNWSCSGTNRGIPAACSANIGILSVTPIAGTGSRIAPSGVQRVITGGTTSFTVTADAGAGILSVTGCGGTLNGTVYTTAAVTGDCSITVAAVFRKGNGGNAAAPTIADALKAYQAYTGEVVLTNEEKICYDVAPLDANGIPQGNGAVDFADVILILRRSIGVGSW